MKRKSRSGFTLIELMLVIAMIGILSSILLTLTNPIKIQQKSRDSRRFQDLDTIKSVLTLAIIENEISFIDTTSACNADGCDQTEGGLAVDGTGYIKFTVEGPEGLSKYIKVLPVDPKNDMTYVFASDGAKYEFNVVLEHDDNLQKMIDDGGNNDSVFEIGTDLTLM